MAAGEWLAAGGNGFEKRIQLVAVAGAAIANFLAYLAAYADAQAMANLRHQRINQVQITIAAFHAQISLKLCLRAHITGCRRDNTPGQLHLESPSGEADESVLKDDRLWAGLLSGLAVFMMYYFY